MGEEGRPYSRSEFNRALIANALTQPFNVILLAAIAIAGLLLDVLPPGAGGGHRGLRHRGRAHLLR